jgi:hypothetical protein
VAGSTNLVASTFSLPNGTVIISSDGTVTSTNFQGNGAGLTNLNVTAVSILTNGGNSGSAFYSIDPGVWGTSSEAFGIAANALGNYSFAAGEQSAANGPESTAIGYSSGVFLAGTNGVAIGFQATVTSPNGVAIGAGASTDVGIAIGEGVTVLGPQVVLGNANITNTILQGVVNGNGAGLTNLLMTTNSLEIPLAYSPAEGAPGTNVFVNCAGMINSGKIAFLLVLTNNAQILVTNAAPGLSFSIEYDQPGNWQRWCPTSQFPNGFTFLGTNAGTMSLDIIQACNSGNLQQFSVATNQIP